MEISTKYKPLKLRGGNKNLKAVKVEKGEKRIEFVKPSELTNGKKLVFFLIQCLKQCLLIQKE